MASSKYLTVAYSSFPVGSLLIAVIPVLKFGTSGESDVAVAVASEEHVLVVCVGTVNDKTPRGPRLLRGWGRVDGDEPVEKRRLASVLRRAANR